MEKDLKIVSNPPFVDRAVRETSALNEMSTRIPDHSVPTLRLHEEEGSRGGSNPPRDRPSNHRSPSPGSIANYLKVKKNFADRKILENELCVPDHFRPPKDSSALKGFGN